MNSQKNHCIVGMEGTTKKEKNQNLMLGFMKEESEAQSGLCVLQPNTTGARIRIQVSWH